MKTYGYDYVFALDGGGVNKILQRNLANVDQTISYTTVDSETGSTVNLKATIAPWSIVGGQNTLLNLNLPFSQGSLTLSGGAITGNYDLSNVTPEMQINLGWVGPGDQQVQTGSGDLTHLSWDPQQSTSPTNPGYVSAVQIQDPHSKLDEIGVGVLKEIMAAALVSNRRQVGYVLANVNPVPANLASWLAPVQWQYFWDQAASRNGVLCFLCMLSQQPLPPPSFDPTALQPGAAGALLISQPVFFANVVLPSVQSTLSGSFVMSTSADGLSTINNNGEFNVGSVTASSYTLSANPAGNGLAVQAQGGGPLKFLFGLANLPNASYSWSIRTNNPVSFDGTNIRFLDDPSPVEHQDQTMPWYDWILIVVLGITDPVGLASMIYDLVEKFQNQAAQVGMATITSNLQSATGGATANAGNLLDWRNGEQMTAVGAGMSESVYVAGNLPVPSLSRRPESALVSSNL
jgi:hypothetical protein